MRYSSLSVVPVVALMTQRSLCPASNRRQALLITIDMGVGYVTTVGDNVAGQGLVVTPSSPLYLTRAEWGDVLIGAWVGSATVAAAKFGVLDCQGDE